MRANATPSWRSSSVDPQIVAQAEGTFLQENARDLFRRRRQCQIMRSAHSRPDHSRPGTQRRPHIVAPPALSLDAAGASVAGRVKSGHFIRKSGACRSSVLQRNSSRSDAPDFDDLFVTLILAELRNTKQGRPVVSARALEGTQTPYR